MFSENQTEIDKELASQDKEQDNTDDYLGRGLVQLKFAGDLCGAVTHEYQEERDQDHNKGVKFCQPGDDDGSEAPASCGTGGNRVRRSGYQKEAGKSADGSGESYGAHDGPFYVDSGIAGGIFTVSHHSDLVTVFCVFQVNKHCHGYGQHNDQVNAIVKVSKYIRQEGCADPTGLGLLVNGSDGSAAFFSLPDNAEEGGQLDGNVVHHQCEKCFVCVPVGLEDGRDQSPDKPCGQAGNDHHKKQKSSGKGFSAAAHHCGSGNTAHQDLALSSDVPEPHFKGGGDGQRDGQQDHRIAQGIPGASAGSDGSVHHASIYLDRIAVGDQIDQQRADQEGKQDSRKPDQEGGPERNAVPLNNADKGFFMFVCFHVMPPLRVLSLTVRLPLL